MAQTRAAIEHPALRETTGNYARHVPRSHPVLRALPEAHPEPTISATAVAGMTDRIDEIARLVQLMPDLPLTVAQRQRLHIISNELLRRAAS